MKRILAQCLLRVSTVFAFSRAMSSMKPHSADDTGSFTRPSLLFIGIMSAPNNTLRRNEIRNTWIKHKVFHGRSHVAVKFMIGHIDGQGAQRQEENLQKEMAIHSDIVRLSMTEGYENLTHKTLTFFKWFSIHHSSSRFAMKLDDDTFPDLDALVPLVEQREAKYVYMGALMDGGPVQRRGKWAEDPDIFPDEVYPTYAAGSGYILSLPLARALTSAVANHEIRLLANEDTTVGVWVHDFAEAHIEEGVDFFGVNADVYGCTDGVTLAMQLQEGEQACMWAKYKRNGIPGGGTCCRPLRCYGLHVPTEGDFEFWKTNPPEKCPTGTTDPVPASWTRM